MYSVKRNIVFMYSGQGSQYKNMGLDLYYSEPIFQYWMNQLDQYFIKFIGSSVFDLLYGDKGKKESNTLTHTHLAIFMVEYAVTQVLFKHGIYPDSIVGVSLGELTASAVNNRISLLECMEMIYEQAHIITKSCSKARMLSILADSQLYHCSKELYLNSEIVSNNFKDNFTIAFPEEKEKVIYNFLKMNQITYVPLAVEYGFHSSLIDDGREPYQKYLAKRNITWNEKIRYKQYSSALVDQLDDFSMDYFWKVVRMPIDFQNTVKKAIDRNYINILVDLGPSGTLATSCKYIFNEENILPYTILSPYGGAMKHLDLLYKELDMQK